MDTKDIILNILNKEYKLEARVLNVKEYKDSICSLLELKTPELSLEKNIYVPKKFKNDKKTIKDICIYSIDGIIIELIEKGKKSSGDTRRFNLEQALILQDILDDLKKKTVIN